MTPCAVTEGWFIYYRIAPADLPVLRAEWVRQRSRWCADHPGLQASLMQRVRSGEEALTMMETYLLHAPAPPGDHARLRRDIERWAAVPELVRLWPGGRTWEDFVPCA